MKNNYKKLTDCIDLNYVRNQIWFTRKKLKKRAFALVEGTSDIGFYKSVINKDDTEIIPMGSKAAVVDTIKALNVASIKGVIAIIDSDYDRLLGIEIEEENIIITDTHDIETMILQSDAFEKFEDEFGDDEKIRLYEEEKGDDVLDKILGVGADIGKMRLISMRDGLNLDFSSVSIGDYFNDDLDFELMNYLRQVLYVSKKLGDKEQIHEKYRQEKGDYDVWQLCRGHDLSEIITILFSGDGKSKSIGNRKAKYIKQEVVEQFLRGAYYAPIHFVKTSMYNSLLKWQMNNPGWNVIKNSLMCVA